MHYVCLDRSVLKEDFILFIELDDNEAKYRWINDFSDAIIPDDKQLWVLSNHHDEKLDFNLRELAELCHITIPTVDDKFLKSFFDVFSGVDVDTIKLRQILPKKKFDEYLNSLLQCIRTLLNSRHVHYYTDVFRRTREPLRALECALIDNQMYHVFMTSENANITSIKTFEPQSDGFAQRTQYSQTSTVTGRLIVSSGPRILTLNNEHKKIIKSRFKGGKIVSIDYVSLEPMLLFLLTTNSMVDDVYEEIIRRCKMNTTRKKVKLLTTPYLYGATHTLLANRLQESLHYIEFMCGVIDDMLDLHTLRDNLKKQFMNDGYITNAFGRPIFAKDDHALLALYTQSTGADASLLGFANVIDSINKLEAQIKPIFVIHDSLLLDVHNDDMRYIDTIVDSCENMKNLNKKLHVKCTVLE